MAQSLAGVYVHIVFSTKNRIPWLDDRNIRMEMHAYLAKVFQEYDVYPFLVGGVEDHVHALCKLPGTLGYAKAIGEVKRNSSRWAKTRDAALRHFYWQSGYGAFSVSYSNVARVKNYILDQERHHQKRTFQDEFRRFLERHGVAYDERYVWD